jgi:carotenoid 1,2-hydratase
MNDKTFVTAIPSALLDESLAIDPAQSGAYQWWYFDATSDDLEHTLVVIVFVGSVFSPWYFAALQRGENPMPQQHCAINVAIASKHDRANKRWIFTEYQRFDRDLDSGLRVGDSTLRKQGDRYSLLLADSEPRAPRKRVQGQVSFVSAGSSAMAQQQPYVLDAHGRHRWAPVAPRCRVEVDLSAPNLRFSGTGYHDLNYGTEPLGSAFERWHWARAHAAQRSRIRYDRVLTDGSRHVLELQEADGLVCHSQWRETRPMPLQLGAWAMWEPSEPCVDSRTPIASRARVESSPFYLRYAGRTSDGEPAVGECLDLQRFAQPIMQRMLPFRARRA